MKKGSCKLTISLRLCYDSKVSYGITGHAGYDALPGNDPGWRICDYYYFGVTLVFKLISWLSGERQTSADLCFKNILACTAISELQMLHHED